MQSNSPNYNNSETSQQGMVGETGVEQDPDETRRVVKTKAMQLADITAKAMIDQATALGQVPNIATNPPEIQAQTPVAGSLGISTFSGAAAVGVEMPRGSVDVPA